MIDGNLLAGRAELWDRVDGAVRDLGGGSGGGALVVDGAAGFGKSRLMAHAATAAGGAGVTVATRRATELDRMAEMSTLLTTLGGCRPIASVLAGISGFGDNRMLLLERLGERLERISSSRPLLIGIDDVDLADDMTVLALQMLVPALRTRPVLWLLARRPERSGGSERRAAHLAVDTLVAAGADRLELGPLGPGDLEELCVQVLGAPPGPDVLELVGRAEGDPFLSEQLLRSVRGDGLVRVVDGAARLHGGPAGPAGLEPPAAFVDAVAWRLGTLSDPARRLVEAGAVLARPFSVHEAAGLLRTAAVDLVPAAAEAIALGTLVDGASELSFRHELIRSAVYAQLSRAGQRALHREAAGVLRAEGRGADEVAEHLLRGGHRGMGEATEVLREAVSRRASRSPAEGVELALRTLDMLDDADPAVPGLAAEAVGLLAATGRTAEAHRLGHDAMHAATDAEGEAALLLAMTSVLHRGGDDAAVVEYARRGLARDDLPEEVRAHLTAAQAYGLVHSGHIDAAAGAARHAVADGERFGRTAAVALGSIVLSITARVTGSFTDAVEHARDAVAAVDAAGGHLRQHHPRLVLAAALVECDEFAEAEAVSDMARREIARVGPPVAQAGWFAQRAELRLAQGRVADAAAEARSGLRECSEESGASLPVALLSVLVETDMLQGDLVAARDRVRRAEALASRADAATRALLTWRAALLLDAEGHRRRAVRTVSGLQGSGALPFVGSMPVAVSVVRLTIAGGAVEHARLAAAVARSLAAANPGVRSLHAAATHADALLRDDPEGMRTAADLYHWSQRLPASAGALEDAARSEASAGDPPRAREMLAEAGEMWTACGAPGAAARAAAAVEALDPPAAAPAAEPEPVPGPPLSVLTAAELKVARLVARGLTNKEVATELVVSRHTVDSHLRRTFAKLEVSSRVELTRRFLGL